MFVSICVICLPKVFVHIFLFVLNRISYVSFDVFNSRCSLHNEKIGFDYLESSLNLITIVELYYNNFWQLLIYQISLHFQTNVASSAGRFVEIWAAVCIFG